MPAVAQGRPAADSTLYTVGVYDERRDPAVDLLETIRRAQASDKRILLEVGGEWCTWCHALDKFLHADEVVSGRLQEGYLIMKVNFSPENENEAFLSNYPKIPGYPHLFVLDSDGGFLHSQGTGELEEGRSYSRDAWLAFLAKWAPGASTP